MCCMRILLIGSSISLSLVGFLLGLSQGLILSIKYLKFLFSLPFLNSSFYLPNMAKTLLIIQEASPKHEL